MQLVHMQIIYDDVWACPYYDYLPALQLSSVYTAVFVISESADHSHFLGVRHGHFGSIVVTLNSMIRPNKLQNLKTRILLSCLLNHPTPHDSLHFL